ncbi:MAG: hypothetical protein H0V17_18305, partial [Deltaproteobacteria bacterium]|nr:hypothetical protein [Deltaproteobacteria bacterium]
LEGGLLETLSESRQRVKHRGPRPEELGAYVSTLRAANRALALDPKSQEAAELVSRLMLEPPIETPPEVEAALTKSDTDLLVRHARLGSWGLIGYLMFFPIMWLGGIREPWLVFGGTAVTLCILATLLIVMKRPSSVAIFASFLAQVVLVAFYARGLSPLLVAPGVALITTLMFASHVRTGPVWLLWAGCAAGVLVPLVLEGLGLVSATTSIEGATLMVHLPAESIDYTVAVAGLGGYVAVILLIATVITRIQAHERRDIQRTIQLQAWQLGQLMPK